MLADSRTREGPRFRTKASALLIVILAACHWHMDWSNAAEFASSLKCGMSVGEVRDLSYRLGAATFAAPTLGGQRGYPEYYVGENERLVSLWFSNGRLTAYQSVRSCIMKSESENPQAIRVELCGVPSVPRPSRP